MHTYTEIAPSSLTSPRKKTPGRERPPAPRFVFGEEPWDRGSSRLRRGACSRRRHRDGASWVGRSLSFALRGTPSPTPGPRLHKSREETARVSAAAVEAHVRWEANPRKAGRSSHLLPEKNQREGSEARGARKGRGESGVWRGRDQHSRLGLKHFCSRTLGFQENPAPEAAAPPPPPGSPAGERDSGEESAALLVTRRWGR